MSLYPDLYAGCLCAIKLPKKQLVHSSIGLGQLLTDKKAPRHLRFLGWWRVERFPTLLCIQTLNNRGTSKDRIHWSFFFVLNSWNDLSLLGSVLSDSIAYETKIYRYGGRELVRLFLHPQTCR